MINSYKDLTVWQKSFELTKQIYGLTAQLPQNEKFALASQMQRSAVSVPSNIAEGQQRNGIREYRQFIGIAKGSAAELETQLLICKDIYDIRIENELLLLTEVQKMLGALSRKLEPNT